MAYEIRMAREADASAIQAIYTPIVRDTAISFEDEPPSVAEMARRIRETLPVYPYLVAEEDGGVLGYVYAGPHRARAAYRWSVDVTAYVAAGGRRRGVGRSPRQRRRSSRQPSCRSGVRSVRDLFHACG
jgi:phosphinothricin acetyltransferase